MRKLNIRDTLLKGLRSSLLACTAAALVACDSATLEGEPVASLTPTSPDETTATLNIVDTAVGNGNFTTLVTALQTAGLDTVLADEASTFTVFAPTDDAFTALGSDAIEALLADQDRLEDVLLYHVIADNNVSSDTAFSLAGAMVEAANGSMLAIESIDGALFINDAQVIATDIATSNGVIHVIDAVLFPAEVNAGDNEGQPGDNGGDGTTLLNIVDTAIAAGSFNTLAMALQATDLDTVLMDDSASFTVFAPTDAAFEELGQDGINALLADPDTLSDILLYHVIGGSAVDAQTAVSMAGSKVTAANGEEFALSLNDGNLFVNLSQVTATDVFASNGVIHVIDAVLVPQAPTAASGSIVDVAVADGRFTTLVAALQATELDTVLADHSGIFTVFAPTDDAFAALGMDTITSLLGDLPTLSNILQTHVISGSTIDSVTAFAATGSSVETASGNSVLLSIRDGSLFVNESRVIIKDIVAENGIIHVIDSVIQ